MRNLSEKFRTFIFKKKTHDVSTPLDLIKTKKGILRELHLSRQARSFLGIYSAALGPGMFLTRVEAIEEWQRHELISLHPYDISGQKLRKTRLSLEEIEMVCPFYKDPVMRADL